MVVVVSWPRPVLQHLLNLPPLTKDTVQHEYTQLLKVVPRTHMVAWDCREYHRGLANRTTTTRFFLFASVFSGKDYNRETY